MHHLPQAVRVGIDGDHLLRLVVGEQQPLPLDAGLAEEDGVRQLGHKVQQAAVHLQTAVLQAAEIQQFLHHVVQPIGFGAYDRKALAVVFILGVTDSGNGFQPALDAGKRGAQLMADRRDELVFHFFGFLQIVRHLVDGGAQAADLIVIVAGRQVRVVRLVVIAGINPCIVESRHSKVDALVIILKACRRR